MIGVVLAVVALAAVALYIFIIRKPTQGPPPPPAPTFNSEWDIRYSDGTPPTMAKEGSGFGVDLPPFPGSIHYVVSPAPNVTTGQVFVMQFATVGTGTVVPTQGSGTPPARLRLYMQRKGDNLTGQGEYEFYRWWSSANVVITNTNEYAITAPVEPELWTSVYGRSGTDPLAGNLFAAALADLDVVGFTFGADFAGHGCFAQGGPVHFTLKSYSVG